jgi:hypothetical protein
MALNYPSLGEGFVNAYQVSASPFVTSSNVSLGQTVTVRFNYVTRFFTLKNNSPTTSVLAFAFTSNGLTPVNSNYCVLSGSESFTGELRTNVLFLSGVTGTSNFSLVAGLTAIPSSNMLTITGSNGFNGVG